MSDLFGDGETGYVMTRQDASLAVKALRRQIRYALSFGSLWFLVICFLLHVYCYYL